MVGYLHEEENTVMRNETSFLSCGVDEWNDAEKLTLPQEVEIQTEDAFTILNVTDIDHVTTYLVLRQRIE